MDTKKIIFSGIMIAGMSSRAYGYIDPGVGNMLVQGILAGSAGALFVFRMFWGRIKARLRSDHKFKQQTETK